MGWHRLFPQRCPAQSRAYAGVFQRVCKSMNACRDLDATQLTPWWAATSEVTSCQQPLRLFLFIQVASEVTLFSPHPSLPPDKLVHSLLIQVGLLTVWLMFRSSKLVARTRKTNLFIQVLTPMGQSLDNVCNVMCMYKYNVAILQP